MCTSAPRPTTLKPAASTADSGIATAGGRPSTRRASMPAAPPASASHLAVAEHTFRMLTMGKDPISIDGRELGHGLPQRMISLRELKSVLLHPSTSFAARDAAWRHLVIKARTGDPAWVVGAVGVAIPALTRMAARLAAGFPGKTADLDNELLTGFLAALKTVDIDAPRVITRLCSPAFVAARRLRTAELAVLIPDGTESRKDPIPTPFDHQDLVLARAVKAGVISPLEADVISATRVGDMSLADYSTDTGRSYEAVRLCRYRGEKRLVAAIQSGRLRHQFDDDRDAIHEATMTLQWPAED